MKNRSIRSGRERRYDFAPDPGFANPEVARYVAALDELLERLVDLIEDLKPDALDWMPPGANNSMAMLVRHIARAEAFWVAEVANRTIPQDLEELLAPGVQDAVTGELPRSTGGGAGELIGLLRRVRGDVTRPALEKETDLETHRPAGGRTVDLRAMLQNQLWHWTYHTGQVGLLRRMAGERYQWRYGDEVVSKNPG